MVTSSVTNTDPSSQQRSFEGVSFERAEDRATLDRDDFMRLFIIQLQNQDPMNPMESAEMASQVAQFNMVDLMYKNNEAMERMAASDEAGTRLQAVSMLGHDVRYTGNYLEVRPEGPKPFDIMLDSPCASCVVTIRDSQGQLVTSWDVGELTPGSHPLPWDGTDAEGNPVPEGTYRVDIQAVDQDGEPVDVTTRTTGTVAGLSYPEQGLPTVRIQNGPEVDLDQIWMVEN